jgi:carbon storage regulator
MLVLTRKAGEGIFIGEDVKVTILESQDGKVRVGIEAPMERKIYRQEVYERICQENRQASQWDSAKRDMLENLLLQKESDA